ncbi:MAG TPA: hypothetical protein VIA45_07880 [Thermoanaerobaculia bacterium]|jgi:hypothetical protein
MSRRPTRPFAPFRFTLAFGCALALATAACGPPTIKPTSSADPQAPCVGGSMSWSIEVLDRRAEREASDKVVALVKDSVTGSFPGCKWSAPGAPETPSILIEINRFSAPFQDGTWNGAADFSVLVRNASGQTLSEFEAEDDVERPNYMGSNNEKEALQEVFAEALRKTLAGLRAVPPS